MRNSVFFLRSLALATILLLATANNNELCAQTTIYNQNFGTGTSLPAGWAVSNSAWKIVTTNSSSGYAGASGGSSAQFLNSNTSTRTLTYNNSTTPLSTIGYQNVTVLWGERLARTAQTRTIAIALSWSSNGSTWNNVAFTNSTNYTGSWVLANGAVSITLPAAAAGIANLRLRISATASGNGSNTTYSVDDFTVQACKYPAASGTSTASCVGGSTGTITASATGGTTPYTYSLNAGAYQSSAIFTGLASGTYTVNVKSNAGCIGSTFVTVSDYPTSTDDQNATATNSWIGHVYDGTAFNNYIGHYTETENFDELFGGDAVCFNVVSNSVTRSIYTETFSVKYRMVSTKKGFYVADLGSDDGSRLTVDGTMIYNNWSDQTISTKPSVLMNLTGASAMLYEFYENTGVNEVKFNNLTLILSNTLATNTTQNICIGNTGLTIGGDVYGTLPTGITLSGTGYQWTYSTAPAGARINIAGATGATYAPSTTISPFNSVGTFYIYRNAVLSSTNNVAPNPYLDTLESNAATIIIAPAPSATISYAGNPFCSTAGISTVTRLGTSGGIYSSTAGLTINASTGSITPVTSTAGTYTVTYTIVAAGGCSEYQVTTGVSIFTAGTWIGAVNTTWNDGTNWVCGTVPTTLTNVTIPTGLTNYPVLNFVGGSVNNITIQSNASLTVNGSALRIAGIISNSGIFNATAGTIEMNGANAQTIPPGTFAGNTITSFIINNTTGVTLADTLNITGDLTVTNGTLNTGGFLVLKSFDTSNARVAQITSTAATPINGNVTVERYIPGKRKYRLITSAVTTSTNTVLTAGQEGLSIWGNWQNGGINTTPNLGTLITGGTLADGFDQGTTNASLYTYDGVNRVFTAYSSANGKNTKYTPLKAGIAYLMFVYGDRLNSVFATLPHNTVLKSVGTLKTGDQTYNTVSAIPLSGITGKFALLGNPFASAIDWARLPKANISDTYWGWDPNLSSTGGYITVSTLGGVTVQAPYSGSAGLNQYIQAGQGFLVKTIGASPALMIREQDKVSDFNASAFRGQPQGFPLIAVNLKYTSNGTTSLTDGVLAVFDPAFSNTPGNEDATKIDNSAESMAILNDATALSIDARQMPQNNDTLFLNVSRLTKPQYTFQIFAEHMDSTGLQAYLQDRYLNTLQLLSLRDTNNIVINVSSSIPASSDINRFRIVFRSSVTLPLKFISIKAAPKNSDIQVDWVIAEERGTLQYEIERAADGSTFMKAGVVSVRKTSNSNQAYQWFDINPLVGNNYCRVRAIQANGSFLLSEIVLVKMNKGATGFSIYPNPVTNHQVKIHANEAAKGKYALVIYNPQAQQIITRIFDHPGGTFNQILFFDRLLPGGNYFMRITGDNVQYSLNFFLE